MEKDTQKEYKDINTLDISDVIAWILLIAGIINFISFIIFSFSEHTFITDKWFSRQFLSFICLGLAGIIFKFNKLINIIKDYE